MNPCPIDRCVCFDVTFAALKELAGRTGADLEELSRRTGCCTGCGMCRPYVRLMLESGRVRFPVMPERDRPG